VKITRVASEIAVLGFPAIAANNCTPLTPGCSNVPTLQQQQQQNIKTRDQCMDAAAGSYSQTISQLDGNPARDIIEGAIVGCALGWETGCIPGAAVGAGANGAQSVFNNWWDTGKARQQAYNQLQAAEKNCYAGYPKPDWATW
jgi:hypothetical protein